MVPLHFLKLEHVAERAIGAGTLGDRMKKRIALAPFLCVFLMNSASADQQPATPDDPAHGIFVIDAVTNPLTSPVVPGTPLKPAQGIIEEYRLARLPDGRLVNACLFGPSARNPSMSAIRIGNESGWTDVFKTTDIDFGIGTQTLGTSSDDYILIGGSQPIPDGGGLTNRGQAVILKINPDSRASDPVFQYVDQSPLRSIPSVPRPGEFRRLSRIR
jgi:hypothetical protein